MLRPSGQPEKIKIYSIKWIYLIHVGYIGYILHTETTPPIKVNELDKENAGGKVNIEILVASPSETSRY